MKIQLIKSEKKVREFSKNFIVILCMLWIVGAIFGGIIVWRNPDQLSYLMDYISGPMEAGIIGYLAKTAFVNREKIRQNPDYLRNGNINEDGPGADGPG